jgi:hypothetical protein
MKYLIDEEELKDFANNVKFNHPSVAVDWQTDQFLKSKQPVEEIASGMVNFREYMSDYFIEDKSITRILNPFDEHKVKIFIQEATNE